MSHYTAQEIIQTLTSCVHINSGNIYSTNDDIEDEENRDDDSDGYGLNDDYHRLYDMANNTVIFIFDGSDEQPPYINISSDSEIDVDFKDQKEIKKYLTFQQFRSTQILNETNNPLKKHL